MAEGAAVLVRIDHLERASEDHEGRIRDLERAHWRMAGVVGLVSALAALAGAYLGSGHSRAAAAAKPPAAEAQRSAP